MALHACVTYVISVFIGGDERTNDAASGNHGYLILANQSQRYTAYKFDRQRHLKLLESEKKMSLESLVDYA